MYFKVAINDGQTFPADSIILWGEILENVGGGYNAASGKFVAPQAGTYRFTITVMNRAQGEVLYMHFMHNGINSCAAVASGYAARYQTGVCVRTVPLVAGEEVWVINPEWATTHVYHPQFTTFEGFMIRGKE